ncbi:MAG: hypothetical protein Q8O61_08965 [Nocardioides sp.]|nr:hypothetical protein [Nocardioides sp.]
MNRTAQVVVGGLGFAVGAAAVVGANLAFPDPEPRDAVSLSSDFCDDTLSDVAGTWGLTVLRQDTVTGDRDELTACEAATASGDVRLTLTVLALVEEEGRAADERTSTMLELACTALRPGATPDDGCDTTVETVDRLVGSASAFVTDDGRAVVSIIFTAPPDRAVGTGRDVAALVQELSDGVT